MERTLSLFKQLGDFAMGFGLIKCIKGMLPGILMLILIGLIHIWNHRNRKKYLWLNLYSFCLLFPLCLMGYSKFYFHGQIFRLSNWMYGNVRPIYGYIYFGVAGILFLRFLIQNLRLNRRVRRLPEVELPQMQREISEQIAGQGDHEMRWQKRRLMGVRIYRISDEVSPFSGGLLHPYIVLPEKILKDWEEREIRMLLCHEMVHIAYGHIWILTLFSLLKIYWWINPLMYLAQRQLQEDAELFCDEKCLQLSQETPGIYGGLLVKMLHLTVPRGESIAFFRRESFTSVKKRILQMGEYTREEKNFSRTGILLMSVLVLAVTGIIIGTSYPRYMEEDTLSLHDETGQILIYDTPRLHAAIQVEDREIHLDEEEFTRLLKEEEITKEFVYLSFGNIQKTPGAGGGGDMAAIYLKKGYPIEFFFDEDWRDTLERMFLKYFI